MMNKIPLRQKSVEKLKSIFAKEADVLAVFIFGSNVTGRSSPDSDLDLAIVVSPETKKDEFYFLKKLKTIDLRDLHLNVVRLLDSSPLLLQQIVKTGTPVYRRSEQELAIFRAQTALRYYDTTYFREIQNYYLTKRLKEEEYGY